VSKINAIYNGQAEDDAVSASVLEKLKTTFNLFVTDLLGLTHEEEASEAKTDNLVRLLIDIRANARANKDFETSDKIRDDLNDMGVVLKDDKSGKTTFEIN
jgi:cysteinyl-tRNA synthetase